MKYLGQSDYQHGTSAHTGVLLVNLGTPEAPTGSALKPYLRQFLSDPRIIEWPRWLWLPILNGIVLQVRPKKSAKLYAKIWHEEGSPLLVYSQRVAEQLAQRLSLAAGQNVPVTLAMRYGQPSIENALATLQAANVRRIVVLPMFPQYSATTVASIFDNVFEVLQRTRWVPEIRTINEYHDHPIYIKAVVDSIKQQWAEHGQPEKLLFSFHGIPKSYFEKGDPYYCHCHKTARLVTEQLGLTAEQWKMCFQSRFGPEEWLQPYTDKTLEAWAEEGIKRVDTVCPGFTVDCLETLEEMAQENRDIFLEAGGEAYHYIPSLNDDPAHAQLLLDIVLKNAQGWLASVPATKTAASLNGTAPKSLAEQV